MVFVGCLVVVAALHTHSTFRLLPVHQLMPATAGTQTITEVMHEPIDWIFSYSCDSGTLCVPPHAPCCLCSLHHPSPLHTLPGKVAFSGRSGSSPYTQALRLHLPRVAPLAEVLQGACDTTAQLTRSLQRARLDLGGMAAAKVRLHHPSHCSITRELVHVHSLPRHFAPQPCPRLF